MRILAKALLGEASGPKAAYRLYLVYLISLFLSEFFVMICLDAILPSGFPLVLEAFCDAALITAILAPLLWYYFIVPVRKLHANRGKLLEQTLVVQEEERKRISRDLHDGLGQGLTSVLLTLRAMEHSAAPKQIECIQSMRNILAESIREIQRVVRESRPPILDQQGLRQALESLLMQAKVASGMRCVLEWDLDDNARFPSTVETNLFRIVQEACTNAMKHSEASTFMVRFSRNPQGIQMQIEDDGIGFDAERVMNKGKAFGILSIQERSQSLGGSSRFQSNPGQGSILKIDLPDKSTKVS